MAPPQLARCLLTQPLLARENKFTRSYLMQRALSLPTSSPVRLTVSVYEKFGSSAALTLLMEHTESIEMVGHGFERRLMSDRIMMQVMAI